MYAYARPQYHYINKSKVISFRTYMWAYCRSLQKNEKYRYKNYIKNDYLHP